jgi:hypothetical protein
MESRIVQENQHTETKNQREECRGCSYPAGYGLKQARSIPSL